MTVADRRAHFRALHADARLFVMPNPWDAGSARLLASFGFEALATTSAGFALSLGRLDHNVSRDELVAHVEQLAAATSLPLNVDSERCFPDDPGGVNETVALLAEAGAAGCSIEDYDPAANAIDDVAAAAERVGLAAEAAHRLPAPMVLTARAENHLHASSTWTTPSRVCSPIALQGRMSCMRRGSRISTRSQPSSRRSAYR